MVGEGARLCEQGSSNEFALNEIRVFSTDLLDRLPGALATGRAVPN